MDQQRDGVTSVTVLVTGTAASRTSDFLHAISEFTVQSEPPPGSDRPARDLGRLALDRDLLLWLLAAPGAAAVEEPAAEREAGLIGAVLLVAPDRPEELPELREVLQALFRRTPGPYVVAVDGPGSDSEQVRSALGLDPHVPVLACDAADRSSVKAALLALLEELLRRFPRTD